MAGTGVPSPKVLPATKAQIAYGKANPAGRNDGTFWSPVQERQAGHMLRQNSPANFLGNKIEGFLGLKQIAQQGAQMFDPRTKAGLANIAGMFIGGPKGEDVLGQWHGGPAVAERCRLSL